MSLGEKLPTKLTANPGTNQAQTSNTRSQKETLKKCFSCQRKGVALAVSPFGDSFDEMVGNCPG